MVFLPIEFEIYRTPQETVRAWASAVRDSVPEIEVVVVESEDDIVWVILPGMLAKRAHAVAAQLLEILAPDRHDVKAAAVGFPADGASAELLVRRCLDLIAQASTSHEEVAST